MKVEQLEDMLAFLDEFGYVSILDIQNRFHYLNGSYEWHMKSNMAIGKNLTKEAIHFLTELVRAKLIIAFPSTDAPILVEQPIYKYPLAKRINYNYKNAHYLPLIFSTFERIKIDGLMNLRLIDLEGSCSSSPRLL